MQTSEVRKLIAQAPESDWFNSVEIAITYRVIKFDQTFRGVSAYHRFLSDQLEGWGAIESDMPAVLTLSKNHFQHLKNTLETFLHNRNGVSEPQLSNLWDRENGNFQLDKHFFTYDCAETKFLVSLQKQLPDLVAGAHSYLIGSPDFNNYENSAGALLAYEFRRADLPKFTHRKLAENSSIQGLINKFREQISESESELSKHLTETTEKYEDYASKIDDFKNQKEVEFKEWFEKTQSDFSKFDERSTQKISALETQYEENLKLKEPAKYWSDLGEKHRNQGWIAFAGFVVFTLIVIYLLRELLWNTPDQLYESFFANDKSAAVRWSIVFVTFISFMAYCIRAIAKVMFSSFHLSRDSQERHTLTYFYLSLLNESDIADKEKELIMQALFSRADTGLLKDDGSPTMPNDFAGRLLK